MKTATPALQALLANKSAQLSTADLYTFTLTTGQVVHWSSLDVDVIFGSNTYTHSDPALSRTALKQKRGLQVDQMTVTLDSVSSNVFALGLTIKQALVAGLFDGATIRIDRIFNPVILPNGKASVDATPYGSVVVFVGYVADVDIGSVRIDITCSPTLDWLIQQFPRDVYQAACPFVTYDARCGVNRASFTATGIAVKPGSTNSSVVIPAFNLPVGGPQAGKPMPDGWLDLGSVTFTSGQNNGLVRSIVTSLGAGNQRNYKTAILNDSPVAYYRLGDAVGSTTASDSGGSFYGATVNGGVTFGQPGPLAGDTTTAALFDGSTGYLQSPLPAPVTLPNNGAAVSVEFWCKPNAVNFQAIFESNPSGVGSSLRNNVPVGSGYTSSAVQWTPSKPVVGFSCVPGVWSHVVVVFRGGRYIDIYVNGLYSSGGSSAGGDQYIWKQANIGRAVGASGGPSSTNFFIFYAGYLAQVAIYNYALSPDQVSTHYLVGTTAPGTNPQGLITLFSALPFAPASGDLMTLVAGDDHSLSACQRKFNNAPNFGGYPFVPSNETAF